MSTTKLSPGKVLLAKDGGIYQIDYRNDFVVCVYDKALKIGALLQLPKFDKNHACLRELVTLLKNEKIFIAYDNVKVIAPGAQKDEIQEDLKSVGLDPAKFVAGETIGREMYFFSDSGRLRVADPETKTATAPATAVVSSLAAPKTASAAAKAAPARKIRVLIIDDSVTIHQLLSKIFEQSPEIEVVGTVADPLQAEKTIKELKPDVMTVDIHMPGMDGVTLLKTILPRYPIPAILVSSLSMEEGSTVLNGLEAGAVDHIQKPTFEGIVKFAPEIIEKVKVASQVKVRIQQSAIVRPTASTAKGGTLNTSYIVAIGSSTGGTEALKQVLMRFPADIPPILVVQHIPPVFSAAFAKRLNEICPFEVCEASDGDIVLPGKVYIAPGGLQMSVARVAGNLKIKVQDTEPVNRHKPSVDVLFNSLAQEGGKKMVGVILTGMGGDGAKGLLNMREAGARTFAQDEATSCVYGMPRVAAELGAVEKVLPLDRIASGVMGVIQKVAPTKAS